MKRILFLTLMMLINGSVNAESYVQAKKIVRNELISCLKDPENARFSAAFNSCLLVASSDFLNRADDEFNRQYKVADSNTRNYLLKDQNIYKYSIKNCEVYQNLSYDGFTREAVCKLQTAKEYLKLLTNGNSSVPKSWKIEDRVDNLFIGY